MGAFPDDLSVLGSSVSTIDAPKGSLSFSPSLQHARIGQGWATWSNGYAGSVYSTSAGSEVLTLPPATDAFYLYAEPDQFSSFAVSATSGSASSGPIRVDGDGGAQYLGFFTSGTSYLDKITITSADPDGFAIGEFGINVSPVNVATSASVQLPSDPSRTASWRVTGTVTDGSGSPLRGARVYVTPPGFAATTDQFGQVSVIRPISVDQNGPASTVTALDASGVQASATQPGYSVNAQNYCLFTGTPGADISALDGVVGNPYLGAAQDLVEALFDAKQSKFETYVVGYVISAPGGHGAYAAKFLVSYRSSGIVKESYTLFGSHAILVAPQGLQSLAVSCGSGTGIA